MPVPQFSVPPLEKADVQDSASNDSCGSVTVLPLVLTNVRYRERSKSNSTIPDNVCQFEPESLQLLLFKFLHYAENVRACFNVIFLRRRQSTPAASPARE
jgi:hypothetical protein